MSSKPLFLFVFLLAGCFAGAQLKITSIKQNARKDWLSFSFPFVHGANKDVARKINTYLQEDVLDNKTIETGPDKLFRQTRYINNDSIHQSGYSMINYKIVVNNTKLLSIEFEIESTGAYSTYYNQYYNFDSRTGEVVTLKDIISYRGRDSLSNFLEKERKKRISAFIKENYEDSEDSTFIKETYAGCLKKGDVEKIFIKQNSILFYKELCFPHVARPYDMNLDIVLNFSFLERCLTPNGKKLLPGKNW